MILAEEPASELFRKLFLSSESNSIRFNDICDKMCVTQTQRPERRDLPTRRGRARGTLRNLT